jgi:hypothetical protein
MPATTAIMAPGKIIIPSSAGSFPNTVVRIMGIKNRFEKLMKKAEQLIRRSFVYCLFLRRIGILSFLELLVKNIQTIQTIRGMSNATMIFSCSFQRDCDSY